MLALSSSSAQAATLLYPNLQTLPPRDLRFDRADVDPNGGGLMHNVLRFSNTVWNGGPGRLEMRGTIDSKTHSGGALQRVYDDSGGFRNSLREASTTTRRTITITTTTGGGTSCGPRPATKPGSPAVEPKAARSSARRPPAA